LSTFETDSVTGTHGQNWTFTYNFVDSREPPVTVLAKVVMAALGVEDGEEILSYVIKKADGSIEIRDVP
jgi:hypothetical protein